MGGLRKQYRGVKLDSKYEQHMAAIEPFKSYNASEKRPSYVYGVYKISSNFHCPFNVYRPLIDIKYVIDDCLDNKNSIYTELQKIIKSQKNKCHIIKNSKKC